MELLLNFIWLMLALPALWVWQRKSLAKRPSTSVCGLRSLALLGCVLTLLFPVVSATDDLHALRPELEESSATRSLAKQVSGERVHATTRGSFPYPGLVTRFSLETLPEMRSGLIVFSVVIPTASQSRESAGRAPPFSQN